MHLRRDVTESIISGLCSLMGMQAQDLHNTLQSKCHALSVHCHTDGGCDKSPVWHTLLRFHEVFKKSVLLLGILNDAVSICQGV